MTETKDRKSGFDGWCPGMDFEIPMGNSEKMTEMIEKCCGKDGTFDCSAMMEMFRDKDGSFDVSRMMKMMKEMIEKGE